MEEVAERRPTRTDDMESIYSMESQPPSPSGRGPRGAALPRALRSALHPSSPGLNPTFKIF